MPQLLVYNVENKRNHLWSCEHQCEVVAETKTYPEIDDDDQITFKIKVADKTYTTQHYKLDYLYDPERLKKMLQNSLWTTYGLETINDEAWVYMYVGMDNTMTVHYRIKLGRLSRTPSMVKKFAGFSDKIEHPWQIHRYLTAKSLGCFYSVITPAEYFELNVSKFEALEV
jgi:hypothetical protein